MKQRLSSIVQGHDSSPPGEKLPQAEGEEKKDKVNKIDDKEDKNSGFVNISSDSDSELDEPERKK